VTDNRARIYIDENLPHQLAGALGRAFRQAIFSSHKDEKLTGVLDLPLFTELQARRFGVIVTRDIAQTIDADERKGLRGAGLHWVGVREPKSASGLEFYSAIVSSIAASVPTLLADITSPPRAYYVECEHLKWQQPIRSEVL
jgi:hypothetical protein